MNTSGVTLRLLDKADKEILKLPRTVKGAFFDFQHKFKTNPHTTGLKLQQLKGDSRLWSARVNDEYRALMLRLAADDWLIVSVKHRKDVYDRLSYGVNQVTGGIEYVDLEVVEDSVLRRLPAPPKRPHRPQRHPQQPQQPQQNPNRPGPKRSSPTGPTNNSQTSALPNHSFRSSAPSPQRISCSGWSSTRRNSRARCCSRSSTASPTTTCSTR